MTKSVVYLIVNKATIIRFACIAILWLLLSYLLVVGQERITLKTLFIIIASGVVVFVPLYKNYRKQQ